METDRKIILAGVWTKEGVDRKSSEKFNFVEIYLSDLTNKVVFKVKPLNTQHFINSLLPKVSELIGKEVAVSYEQRVYNEELESRVVDIVPVKVQE